MITTLKETILSTKSMDTPNREKDFQVQNYKFYQERIPACGIFCGGCPVFVRDRKPCPGAGINIERCLRCKSFHLCCTEKGITHCYQCKKYPCRRLKDFATRWLKYGQNILENQNLLKEKGNKEFLNAFNSKVKTQK